MQGEWKPNLQGQKLLAHKLTSFPVRSEVLWFRLLATPWHKLIAKTSVNRGHL